jgi:glycosyltransferase involved in cell wall biosynthesis
MTERKRLVVVVKYAAPTTRISGIVEFLRVLLRHLTERWDVHVVSYDAEGTGRGPIDLDGYSVHRVGFPFPVTAGHRAASLDPDATIVVSGINDLRLAVPYFGMLAASLGPGTPAAFFQATNVKAPPSRAFTAVVRRFSPILCGGPRIHADFARRLGDRALPLPPAVDVGALSAVQPAPKSRPLRFGFVNHFRTVKGADLALDAFAALAEEHDDIEFLAAGTGPLGETLRSRYRSMPRIQFRGYLHERERLALMRSCDVMALPFRTDVSVLGLSQTVLECLALGVVVVGSDTPSIAPALRPGVDGLLVDEEELLPALRRLHDDAATREAMAAAARERAIDFDVGGCCRALEKWLVTR